MVTIAAPYNKSLDVTAKQRFCYRVAWFTLACVVAVSPHVNSIVGRMGKKGSDKDIDGIKVFVDVNSGKVKRVIVEVNSGHVKSGDIRDLVGNAYATSLTGISSSTLSSSVSAAAVARIAAS